jgi:hypothetical protein
VPNRWPEDSQLGHWVSGQRKFKKALARGEPRPGITAARAAKLDALGFEWQAPAHGGSLNDADWEAQLAKLKAYKRRHGDCNVPARWAEDSTLGLWVSRQRAYRKALDRGEPSHGMTAARAAKLEGLGFEWQAPAHGGSLNDASWEAQLAKLKAYKRRHGDCNVPQGWAEDRALGSWVSKQRMHKKKLDRGEPSEGMAVARAAKLDALGFAWELSAAAIGKQLSKGGRDHAAWEAQLAKLKVYKRRYGDCSVPKSWAEDKPLGRWVNKQRTFTKKLDRGEPSGGMTTARAAKLEALGFACGVSWGSWGVDASLWVILVYFTTL